MILGIGVDIVHLPRIAAIVNRKSGLKFARRVLGSEELAQWECIPEFDIQKQVRFLAVRWAVKEAAYKALYPKFKPTWKELRYQGLTLSGEKPSLKYESFTKQSEGSVGPLHVSVSHDGEYTVAYVLAEGKFHKNILNA
ncbi:4'-phosphopantetheinyl transferase [Macrolepiota fuliginosa MF-IS2]|uniref:4'-phosphopantetheinyl transferase n=1 Tax=Macrolepiota fuliginosa MF-IS2 TaxID=1400762 RepID=A0A9P5XNS4_9AGAR|nr:4'-phosphopantetheinyl transferase [Macrolepiota fuliginosa MF-IS2]